MRHSRGGLFFKAVSVARTRIGAQVTRFLAVTSTRKKKRPGNYWDFIFKGFTGREKREACDNVALFHVYPDEDFSLAGESTVELAFLFARKVILTKLHLLSGWFLNDRDVSSIYSTIKSISRDC